MRINKATLAEHVAAEAGMNPAKVARVLEAFFDVVARKVVEGDAVAISNFGTWSAKPTPERLARNPQNGDVLVVPAGRRPVFSYSPTVRKAVVSGAAPATLRKNGTR
jgi:DNA-binding protein HU-beta